ADVVVVAEAAPELDLEADGADRGTGDGDAARGLEDGVVLFLLGEAAEQLDVGEAQLAVEGDLLVLVHRDAGAGHQVLLDLVGQLALAGDLLVGVQLEADAALGPALVDLDVALAVDLLLAFP